MMEEQVSDTIESTFNVGHFINFLKDHNILATTIAAVLSGGINEVTTTFVEHLIIPVINRDGNTTESSNNKKKLEDVDITVFDTKVKIGRVILAFFKFIIITYIIFILAKIIKNVSEH